MSENRKEALKLGKDLNLARVAVMMKHGYTSKEISNLLGLSDSVVRRLMEQAKEKIIIK